MYFKVRNYYSDSSNLYYQFSPEIVYTLGKE